MDFKGTSSSIVSKPDAGSSSGSAVVLSSQAFTECGKCDKLPGVIPCTCGEVFCELCFVTSHLRRNPTHRRKPASERRIQHYWNTITNVLSAGNHSYVFKRDEAAKWFGFSTKITENDVRVSMIAETPRLANLLDRSAQANPQGSSLQFPSIVSFTGLTGAGKSVIIRSLIYLSAKTETWESLEAPVPGASSGAGLFVSTTGEVNLYPEPSSLGTETPLLLADCEGLAGTEPLAAKHQNDWVNHSRRYRIEGARDRNSVVKTIYPRFLYIFSDVICYVTNDHRSWADTTVRMLEWSSVGAQNTINQYTLPALIIILNAPSVENEAWVSDDEDFLTREFFAAISEELEANDTLRALAKKYGETNIQGLFKRNYLDVHVHYIPRQGSGRLGGVDIVHKQNQRLLDRIRSDSQRVQAERAKSLTRFDSKQLSTLTDLAFKHLATGDQRPFDFGLCRRNTIIPETLHLSIGEYLRHCFKPGVSLGLPACVPALGIIILRNALSAKGEDDILIPSTVFNPEIRGACLKAIESFYDENVACAYIDQRSGERCVNTKAGHGAKGHQNQSGKLMENGEYIESDDRTNPESFVASVDEHITNIMHEFKLKDHSDRKIWRTLAIQEHEKNIRQLRRNGIYPRAGRAARGDPFRKSSICYGCLFQKPEYLLPCDHTVCEECIRAHSDSTAAATTMKQATGKHTLTSCIICGTSIGLGWPFKVNIRPQLSGIRVLSLDGGGVRGISQLAILKKLESRIGLGLPIGDFFDIIVGTSTGGIAALALGVYKKSATNFIPHFKEICNGGFSKEDPGSKSEKSFWEYLNTFFTFSPGRNDAKPLYFSENLRKSLQEFFESKSHRKKGFFGLNNHCRVAVTTTVASECQLIANYTRGDHGRYMYSDTGLVNVALCTSAAPPYFPPHVDHGAACRDGGLKENNPIHLAVTESRALWDPRYDLILSIGSGKASNPQDGSEFDKLIEPTGLRQLFHNFLSTMNGNDAWIKFQESWDKRITERSSRLNVEFAQETEPSFDSLSDMGSMEGQAERCSFEQMTFDSPFQPIVGTPEDGLLEVLADRLRASLFFLQVKLIDKTDGFVVTVKGTIRCRLGPGDEGFDNLLSMVSSFKVNNETIVTYPESGPSSEGYFVLDIEFSHESVGEAIRIDVNFGKTHWVTISGCPITIKEVMEEWDSVEAQDETEDKATRDSLPPDDSADAGPSTPNHETESRTRIDYFTTETEQNGSRGSVWDNDDTRSLQTDDASDFSFDGSS